MKRRRFLYGAGVGAITSFAGCSNLPTEQVRETPTNTPTEEETASPTTTTEPAQLQAANLAGFQHQYYNVEISGERDEQDDQVTIKAYNKSDSTIPAVHTNWNDDSYWITDIPPQTQKEVYFAVEDAGSLQLLPPTTTFPALWPDPVPSELPFEPLRGFTKSNKDGESLDRIFKAEEGDDAIHIPLPPEAQSMEISEVYLEPVANVQNIGPGDINLSGSDITVTESQIEVPVDILPIGAFGHNPYVMKIVGLNTKISRMAVLPVPDFSVSNLTAIGVTENSFLEWSDVSYDLTVGSSVINKVELATVAVGVSDTSNLGGYMHTTTVSTGKTHTIELDPPGMNLPIDTENFGIMLMTPYPVLREKIPIEV